MKNILIGIPAYNEEKTIYNLILKIRKKGFENILVLDDCSQDNTKKLAIKAKAKVISHPINRKGPGAPTYSIIEYAKQNNFEKLVLIDADEQHCPEDILKLLKYSNKYDVIIGSRMISNIKKMPIQRKIANFIGSFITYFFFGLFVKDSQSGFKVLNKKAINKIKITYDTYEFCSEIIGEIYKNQLSFKEVPIKVIYTNNSLNKKNSGQSIKNGFKMLFKFFIKN